MEWVFFLGEPYNMCRWKREMKKEVSTLLILYKEHKLLFSLLIKSVQMLIESKLTLNALAVLTQIFKIPYTSETVA